MSVNNGQDANETTFNNAFMSRTGDTDTIGKVDLLNADSDNIEDAQLVINQNKIKSESNEVRLDAVEPKANANETRSQANELAISNLDGEAVKVTGDQLVAGNKTFSGTTVFTGDAEFQGTTTTVNSQTLDVVDPNITINDGGTDASSEGSGITVERVGDNGSIVYEDALDNKFKVGVEGSETEIKSIVKDTEANILAITTYSSSVQYYATDTGKRFEYNTINSSLLELGSGSGGVGSSSIYSLLNAEDEDLTGFTNITTTSSSISGDFSYSVSSFNASLPIVTLDERQKSKLNSVEMIYRMVSGSAKIVVRDDLLNILGEVEISSTIAQKATLQFFVPSSAISVQLSFEDVSSGTGIVFDDVEFSDSPFTSVNFSKREVIRTIDMARPNFWDSTSVGVASFDESLLSGLGGAITIVNSGGQDRLTAQEDTLLHISASARDLGTNGEIRINDSNGNYLKNTHNTANDHNAATEAVSIFLKAGDYCFVSLDTAVESREGGLYIVAESSSENLVFSQSGTENTFSGTFDGQSSPATAGDRSIRLNAGGEWLDDTLGDDGVTRSATGNYIVHLKPGFFKEIPDPNVVALTNQSVMATIGSVSLTEVNVIIRDDGGIFRDHNFSLCLERSGSDYKNPNAYAVVSPEQTVYIKDVKPSGTGGGTGTTSYSTRTLNTITGDNFARISSNQIIIEPGTYDFLAEAPAYNANAHKAKLINITTGLDEIIGTSEFTNNLITTKSTIKGKLVLTEETVFEIVHRVSFSTVNAGFGNAVSFGDDEIYTQVVIRKLK